MAMQKITEKTLAESVSNGASVLITQPGRVAGEDAEVLLRASLETFIAALRANGVNDGFATSMSIQAMYPTLVKGVTQTDEGLVIKYWNNSSETIQIKSGGLAFDSIRYDKDTGYFHILSGETDVVTPVYIGGGGSSGDFGTTIKLTNRMPSRTLNCMESDTELNILYNATSNYDDGEKQATGSLTANWYVDNRRVLVERVEQGDNSCNIRSYLTVGATSSVKLTIEDNTGNSRSTSWTATVSSFGLKWNLEDVAIHSNSEVLRLSLVPSGEGTIKIYVKLDGNDFYNTELDRAGRTVTVNIPAQAHGAHNIEAWLEATVDGSKLETEHLKHAGIWIEDGNTTPIIAVCDDAPTIKQFGTANIRYEVYQPGNETADVDFYEGDIKINQATVGRTPTTWPYRATEAGVKTLKIKCGSVEKAITLTVEELGYNIKPVTDGLVLDLDPAGHTNADTDRTSFGYEDEQGVNHPLTFSDNFDWENGGFQLDEDGVTAFVVKRGTYATADTSLFANNAKTNGKEVKIVFKTTKCRDFNSVIIDGMSNDVGLRLQAHSATLGSELRSTTVPYCVDKKIELDVNIDTATDSRLAIVWLEGVPSRGMEYSASDNWAQSSPKNLVIGSEDCDVWIYRIKMYDTVLTKRDVLDNWIADCADPTEMINRYVRNDIFTSKDEIDISALGSKNPELRIIKIKAVRMTTSKEDEIECDVELTYTLGGADYEFTATGVIMKAQGTSSLEYILAALNIDLDFSNAVWKDGNGKTITAFAMTPTSIPVSYFTIKVNVASSESANNVCEADDYNTYQPALSAARQADPRVRDTIEGHPCVVFFENASDEDIVVGARTVKAKSTIMYARGDMCNSKKNYAVFGQDNETYPEQFCIEITNNNNAQARFKSDDLSTETWDGDKKTSNFEPRYPKKLSDAQKRKWQQFLSWVVSTDREQATGDSLPTVVTYDGVSFTNDTAAYRLAKFRAEFYDWCTRGSFEYHYVTTHRNLMIDNRAKNTFISYEYDPEAGGYRFNIGKNYDDDTLAGNDNSGNLIFHYGLEDTDTYNGARVFNAHDSVLWLNVRDGLAEECRDIFVRLEKTAFSADRIIKKWQAYQSAFPTALVVEDMYNKYLTARDEKGNLAFIDKMWGTKEDQFIQFQTYRESYFSSKMLGPITTDDRISLRTNAPDDGEWQGVEPSGDIAITLFADGYVNIDYGNAGRFGPYRLKGGQSIVVPAPEGANLGDLETYIYGASNISYLGSLAALYTKFATLSTARRLREIILGSAAEGYENKSLNTQAGGVGFGNNDLLEVIDLRGTPNLVQDLDLTHLTSLKTLYAINSGVTSAEFAPGAPVETALIGNVKKLTARGLVKLQNFSCGFANLETIWVENSPGINTARLVANASKLVRGRLPDVDWTVETADAITRLARLGGLDANGEPTEHFVLEGSCYISAVSQEELVEIREAFPKLEVRYGEMLESYTLNFYDEDGVTLLYTEKVRQYGAGINPVSAGLISTPTKASTVENNYTFTGWDKPFNYVISNLNIKAVYAESARTYTVRWWKDSAESILVRTLTGVEAHAAAVYDGPMLSDDGGAIWMGWDKPTTDVVGDTDVHAVFVTPRLPDAVATNYDYLYSDDPNDNSAYSLAEFYGIYKTSNAKLYFQPKDKIKICVSTSAFKDTVIILQLEHFNHFKLADGSGNFAPVSFGMVGIMNANHNMNSNGKNIGGWANCGMRTFLNNDVYPALPVQWKAMIKQVQVISSDGDTLPSVSTSNDYLYLRSASEVGFNKTEVPYSLEVDAGAEDVQSVCYTDNTSRIKKYYNNTGSANTWWLRSPLSSNDSDFVYVNNNGSYGNGHAGGAYGVSFGFSLG